MKIKAHARFHWMNTKNGFLGFGMVMCVLIGIGLIFNASYSRDGNVLGSFGISHYSNGAYSSSLVGIGIIVVPIYMIVVALSSIPESFGHLISLGSTRKSIYQGVVLYDGVLALVLMILQCLAFQIEGVVYWMMGWNHLPVREIFENSTVTDIFSFGILYFSILMGIASLVTLASSFFYKVNHRILRTLVIGLMVFGLFNERVRQAISSLWAWIFNNQAMYLTSLKLILLSVLLFLAGWLFMRRAEVKQ